MKKICMICCFLFCFLLSGISVAQSEVREESNPVWYRLYMGLGMGGAAVKPETVLTFFDKEVTSRFPQGFSVTGNVRGQWLSDQGIVRERNIVLNITVADTPENEQKIEQLAQAYTKRFANAKASVFVVRIPVAQATLYHNQ